MRFSLGDGILILIGVLCHVLRPILSSPWLPVAESDPAFDSTIFTIAVFSFATLFYPKNLKSKVLKVLSWLMILVISIMLNEFLLLKIWCYLATGIEKFCKILGSSLGCNEFGRVQDGDLINLLNQFKQLAHYVKFGFHLIIKPLFSSLILIAVMHLKFIKPMNSMDLEDLGGGDDKAGATPRATPNEVTNVPNNIASTTPAANYPKGTNYPKKLSPRTRAQVKQHLAQMRK